VYIGQAAVSACATATTIATQQRTFVSTVVLTAHALLILRGCGDKPFDSCEPPGAYVAEESVRAETARTVMTHDRNVTIRRVTLV